MTGKKPFEDTYGLFKFDPSHTPLERAMTIAMTLLSHHAQPKPGFSREAYYEAKMEISYQWGKHLRETRGIGGNQVAYTRRQMEREKHEKQTERRNENDTENDSRNSGNQRLPIAAQGYT